MGAEHPTEPRFGVSPPSGGEPGPTPGPDEVEDPVAVADRLAERLSSDRLASLAAWLLSADEDAIYDYGYQGIPRCPICGRVVAAIDCDPDPDLCWRDVSGSDVSCRPGRRPPPLDQPESRPLPPAPPARRRPLD